MHIKYDKKIKQPSLKHNIPKSYTTSNFNKFQSCDFNGKRQNLINRFILINEKSITIICMANHNILIIYFMAIN